MNDKLSYGISISRVIATICIVLCHIFSELCPKNAITIKEHKDGFLYPVLNNDLCVNCEKCINICPLNNKNLKNSIIDVYGTKAKDTEILKNSQLGGMGFLLGKYIIEQGLRCCIM